MATGDAGYSQSQLQDDQYNQQMLSLSQSSQARSYVNNYIKGAQKITGLSWMEDEGENGLFVNLEAGQDEDGAYKETYNIEQFAQKLSGAMKDAVNQGVNNDRGVRSLIHTEAGRYFWALANKYPSDVANRLLAPGATWDKFKDIVLPEGLGGNVEAWWNEGLVDPAKLMVVVREGNRTRLSFMAPGTQGNIVEAVRSVDLNTLFTNPGQQNTIDPLLRDMGVKIWDKSIDPTGRTLVDGSAKLYKGFNIK